MCTNKLIKLPLFFFLNVLVLQLSGQSEQSGPHQKLLDMVSSQYQGAFIHSKPISRLGLDSKEMRGYYESHLDYTNKKLDTIMFLQIIHNSSHVDTSLWKDEELPGNLLVHSRDESVSKGYAIQKLQLKDKSKIRWYKKQINKFNSTNAYDKNLYYFSRPIFDDSGTFAIIRWNNGHSGLGGGGAIILFHFENDGWNEIGAIERWRY